ncbi:MAG: hypothetical protein NTW13_05360, partial [Candidatus Omnitrophica bacterium]|nr:hypothetical protein [Candidatus Omnitrophota bacterium]
MPKLKIEIRKTPRDTLAKFLNFQKDYSGIFFIELLFILGALLFGNRGLTYLYAEDNIMQAQSMPITINGDTVEYSTDKNEASASGDVEITYRGSKMTCQKLVVNTQTKDGVALGNVRLEDEQGVVEGDKIVYNFQSKTGTIIDAQFRSNPYFGRARKLDKVSEAEFIARYGYATTCSLDKPHYRIGSSQINMLPKNMIQTKNDTFYLWKVPILYLPNFNHYLQDPMMHVQVTPGKTKDWGPFILSTWRYNLAKNVEGRVYLDARKDLGWAEGFGLNYNTEIAGKGDFKFYYTDEKPSDIPKNQGFPKEYQRYLLRWRHKWDIDKNTNIISEFVKIKDEERKKYDPNKNFLKDYFFREYEKDSQPLSYALFHHSFVYSSIDVLLQDRVNHWYDQLSKIPEVKYTLPSLKLGDTPLYFENNSVFTSFNKKAITAPTSPDDLTVSRLDTINKLSMPMKVAFLNFSPFVQNREIAYDKSADGKALPVSTVFYAGGDLSTKFYKASHLKTNFLGLDLNGLRHI